MELKELREMAREELAQQEKKLQKELFALRFQLMTGRVENPMRVREIRREIARIQTIHTERKRQGEEQPSQAR
jgi:large subunit ribosomal protein L29